MYFYVLDKYPYTIPDKYKNTILLIHDNWDDWFCFETQCNVHYIDEKNNDTYLGEIKIGQINMKPEQRTANYPTEFMQLPDDCFSLGQSEDYYDKIKTLFNENLRREYFIALRDVAFDLSLFEQVKNSSVTKTSLLRYVSPFAVENQYNRIAKGKARLTNYDIEYTYPNSKIGEPIKLVFNVEPHSYPPTNIHVVIGRNNVGKTFLIKKIITAAYDNSSNTEQNGRLRSTNSSTGRLINSRKQAFANILCISFSPFDNYDEILGFSELENHNMPFSFIGLRNITDVTLGTSFVKSLAICQKNHRKMSLLKNALNILETDSVFEQSKLIDLISTECNNDSKVAESKENQDEVKKKFDLLSSGHQVIMLSLVQLIECLVERSFIVLDEPENHLHPPLLSAFIRALSELLIEQNGVALIATHSPVILQEVPKSCVWKINRSGYEVSANRPEIETFGANIGALTYEVFGLEVNNSGFHKMLLEEVNKGDSYIKIIKKFNRELGEEAKSLLRTMIHERDDKN